MHLNRRNIYGDEINHVSTAKITRRQRCTDCGKALNQSLDFKGQGGNKFMDTDALLSTINKLLEEINE